ncbi:BlaI/MecI/CopY family transcriptional regulator [Mangrovivirga cuniculi]|uniref:Transcriptional regulator n=1 Tax=Mangrovivirga cuniculi TaxID=2715131 RepID=A0A4D7JK30_9BACT|nr:BlaI/MecI/CopY family transcriptional regulator [Mangrovivirga cuniculi]QCK15057.1 transcriptional regulator [Mangrovivirga cuniculi]
MGIVNKDDSKVLTKAEEQVMQILWDMEKGFVKDILDKIPEPKPAYNTVSTIVRILEKKGFVGYKAYGKTHEYYPIIDKETYSNEFLQNFIGKYFKGSFQNLVSFFAKENNVDAGELDKMMKMVKKDLDKEE